jgi:hypothetical protein
MLALCVWPFSAQTQITIGKRARLFMSAKKSLNSSLSRQLGMRLRFCQQVLPRLWLFVTRPSFDVAPKAHRGPAGQQLVFSITQ